jgi:hypothetical protein
MYDKWSEKSWLSIHISVISRQAALQQANYFYESDELFLWQWKQTDGTWLTGQRFCCRLTAEMTRAFLEHDTFLFEFVRNKVSNCYFSEKNRRRLFIFPRGEGVEFLLFREPSTFYLSDRGRRIFIFLRAVDFFFFEQKKPSTFFVQKKPSTFYLSTFFEQKKPSTFYFSTFIFEQKKPSTLYFPDTRSRRILLCNDLSVPNWKL